MGSDDSKPGRETVDEIVARARKLNAERMQGYREQSLKIHPWVCARCGRQFTIKTLNQLTVHHKDHNHNNNPPDGSNWENLCVYCHDHEHGRDLGEAAEAEHENDEQTGSITHNPFARLGDMLKNKDRRKK